ncbi:MAG: hypothetical protein PHC41_12670 [Lachnospiraceae bacterium]|nr:hypothetical protein [Lachnospiraceae bacterium]MDD3617061.1 hypothetical protein [Lachnospiraceae bacterium]
MAYYGIGGIGKTTLLDKLISDNFKNPNPKQNIGKYYIKYDFETSNNEKQILTALRNMLIKLDSRKFSFVQFDLACLKYAEQTGSGNDLIEKSNDFIESSPLLKAALEVGGAIPIASTFTQIISAINESKNAIIGFDMKRSANRISAELNNLQENEILQKLPEYFSMDLNKCTEKLKKPLVIFLDTYEKLANYLDADIKSKDDWLVDPNRGIISQSNHILWVLAGRDKPQFDWESMGFQTLEHQTLDQVENPDEYVESKLHLLGNLSDTDAIGFLTSAQIPERYHSDIYNLTMGNPLWLDVAVGFYENSINRGTSFSISGIKSASKMLERYIKYMDNDMQDLVKQLAILGKWDNNSLSIINNINYTIYDKIKRSCMIHSEDSEYFYMHSLIRENICEFCKQENYEPIASIYKNTWNYYVNELDNADNSHQSICLCNQSKNIW